MSEKLVTCPRCQSAWWPMDKDLLFPGYCALCQGARTVSAALSSAYQLFLDERFKYDQHPDAILTRTIVKTVDNDSNAR